MKARLISLASWAGLLVSAVSECGCEADFPLTLARRSLGVGGPPLWLAVAVFAFFVTTAHGALTTNSWTLAGSGKWETAGNWSRALPPTKSGSRAVSMYHSHQ